MSTSTYIGIFILDLKIKNHIEENKEMYQKEEILGGTLSLTAIKQGCLLF